MKVRVPVVVARTRASIANVAREWLASPPSVIRLWREDREFADLMRQIAGHTVVDQVRCFMIYQYARQVSRLSGEVAEVGTYRGGTGRLLAKAFEPAQKNVHLFDTFSGMPTPDAQKDVHRKGDFADTSLQEVERYLQDCPNVRLHPGMFPSTAQPIKDTTFCFVHIDADIYRSVTDCCQFFYPRMVRGGVMIFDDYGVRSCPGAKQAVDEFFTGQADPPCYLPTGQCVVIRLNQASPERPNENK